MREPIGFKAWAYHLVVSSEHFVQKLRIFYMIAPSSVAYTGWTSLQKLRFFQQFESQKVVEVFRTNLILGVLILLLRVKEILWSFACWCDKASCIFLKATNKLENLEQLPASLIFIGRLIVAAVIPLLVAELRRSGATRPLARNSVPVFQEIALNEFKPVKCWHLSGLLRASSVGYLPKDRKNS